MIGDRIHDMLETAGITPDRVSRWLGRPCRCPEYQDRLNQIHAGLNRYLSGKMSNVREWLTDILDDKT